MYQNEKGVDFIGDSSEIVRDRETTGFDSFGVGGARAGGSSQIAVARYKIAPCHSQGEPHGAKGITLQSVSHEPFPSGPRDPDDGITPEFVLCFRKEGSPYSERFVGSGPFSRFMASGFPARIVFRFRGSGFGSTMDLPFAERAVGVGPKSQSCILPAMDSQSDSAFSLKRYVFGFIISPGNVTVVTFPGLPRTVCRRTGLLGSVVSHISHHQV